MRITVPFVAAALTLVSACAANDGPPADIAQSVGTWHFTKKPQPSSCDVTELRIKPTSTSGKFSGELDVSCNRVTIVSGVEFFTITPRGSDLDFIGVEFRNNNPGVKYYLDHLVLSSKGHCNLSGYWQDSNSTGGKFMELHRDGCT